MSKECEIENLIIIPYRDRKPHLDFFINKTWPILRKNIKKPYLLIVEQTFSKPFNRGLLINVGAEIYKDKANYITMNDVDANPISEEIFKQYDAVLDNNQILGIMCPPCDTLGCVSKISMTNFHKINGYPNYYYGWGCEDRALYNRALFYDLKIDYFMFSNSKNKDEHFILFNDIDDRQKINLHQKTVFEYNKFHTLSNTEKQKYIDDCGVKKSTQPYTIIETQDLAEDIKLIKVNIE